MYVDTIIVCLWVREVRKMQVLLVDDDIEILDVTRLLMKEKNQEFDLIIANSVQDALQKLESENFDVVIADYLMPGSTGLDLLQALRSSGDDIGFIMWTGHSSEDIAIKSLNLGADYYIVKDVNIKEQIKQIQNTIAKLVAKRSVNQPKIIHQEDASEFIHKLSHDVIGTLQNIMGYTTLLNEEYDKSYLEGISRLTEKLNTRMKTAVSDIDNGELCLNK